MCQTWASKVDLRVLSIKVDESNLLVAKDQVSEVDHQINEALLHLGLPMCCFSTYNQGCTYGIASIPILELRGE